MSYEKVRHVVSYVGVSCKGTKIIYAGLCVFLSQHDYGRSVVYSLLDFPLEETFHLRSEEVYGLLSDEQVESLNEGIIENNTCLLEAPVRLKVTVDPYAIGIGETIDEACQDLLGQVNFKGKKPYLQDLIKSASKILGTGLVCKVPDAGFIDCYVYEALVESKTDTIKKPIP